MSSFKKEFKLKFHGVRGSHPTPAQDKLKYGGNTACIAIVANGHTIIIDAGTGIISLGDELLRKHIASGSSENNRTPIETNLFISHSHYDHIQGLPFFKPAFINSSKLNFFGAPTQDASFKETVSKPLYSPYFPLNMDEMKSNIKVYDIKATTVVIFEPNKFEPTIISTEDFNREDYSDDCVVVQSYKSTAHPKDGVLVYKISCNGKDMVYATDIESFIGGYKRLNMLARNTDLFIHDAQFSMDDYVSAISPKQGFGHSTPEMAIENAKATNAKQLILFHIDPSYDDEMVQKIELQAQNLFTNCNVAYEGMEINLL